MCKPEVCRRRIHWGVEVSRDNPLEVPLADPIYPFTHSSRYLRRFTYLLYHAGTLLFRADVPRVIRRCQDRREC